MRTLVSKPFAEGLVYAEFAGLSTESKPTTGIVTGSLYRAVDTGKVYAFAEGDTPAWYDQDPAPES